MIPSMVVQTLQTSAMGVDVIASFRNIFGSKEFTVSCLEGRSRFLLERFSLVLGRGKNPSSNHSIVLPCGNTL